VNEAEKYIDKRMHQIARKFTIKMQSEAAQAPNLESSQVFTGNGADDRIAA
jgi:hypothetical protein